LERSFEGRSTDTEGRSLSLETLLFKTALDREIS